MAQEPGGHRQRGVQRRGGQFAQREAAVPDVSGTSAINGGSITTSNRSCRRRIPDYTGAVTLGANTTLKGSTVSFDDQIAGASSSLTISGNAIFGDNKEPIRRAWYRCM